MRNTKELQHFYLRRGNIVQDKNGREYPSNMRFGVVALRKVDGGVKVSATMCSPDDEWDTKRAIHESRGKTLCHSAAKMENGREVKNRYREVVFNWVLVTDPATELWGVLRMLNYVMAINLHYPDFVREVHQKKFEHALEEMLK